MEIKNKLFPYPVLCSFNDDYIDSIFQCLINQSKSFKEIIIEYQIDNSNKELKDMVDLGKSEYVFHIECPNTSYRKIVKTDALCGSYKIPLEKVNDTITINLFLVAKENIPGYSNSNFNKDYSNITFQVLKGNILAIADPYKIVVEKQDEDLGKIESIFSIAKRAADDSAEIKIELNTDKIKLMLNKEDYINYNKIVNNPVFLPALQSILIFPALIYIFDDLKNGGFEDYADKQWFKSMSKTFEKNGSILNMEFLENKTSFELAQAVLDSPIKRAFEQIVNMDLEEEEDL